MTLYIGKYRGNLYETVYGFIKTGYWYMGGKEKPYLHHYYGIVAGEWTFGLGIIKEDLNE